MSVEVREKLLQYAHHICPENYDTGDILTAEQFLAADDDDPAVTAALRSYQKWFKADLDELTQAKHKRFAVPDGDEGPATQQLFEKSRCGMPDFQSREEGQLEGNWPPSCRNDITTSIDPNMQLDGLSRPQIESLWQEADQNWAAELNIGFDFQADNYPNTRIFAFRANLSGSTLADQYLATGNCGFQSQGRIDNRQWNEVLFVTVVSHEHGHALGSPHNSNPASLMYPSIHQQSMARRGRPHPSDLEIMYGLGYTKRTEPEPPPEPDWLRGNGTIKDKAGVILGRWSVEPDTEMIETDGEIWFDDTIFVRRADSVDQFIIVPKTELL